MINTRRGFLTTMGCVAGITICDFAVANSAKVLSEPTKLLVAKVDEWRRFTNNPIYFYDDPNIYKCKKYGIYGWYDSKSLNGPGWVSTSIDWDIENNSNSNTVLTELVNYYGGKVLNVYDGKKKDEYKKYAEKSYYYQPGLEYQEKGYICGVKV